MYHTIIRLYLAVVVTAGLLDETIRLICWVKSLAKSGGCEVIANILAAMGRKSNAWVSYSILQAIKYEDSRAATVAVRNDKAVGGTYIPVVWDIDRFAARLTEASVVGDAHTDASVLSAFIVVCKQSIRKD